MVREPTDPQVLLRYRNRAITRADVAYLSRMCAKDWGASPRTALAEAVCEAWEWRQANGSPSVYACKDLLLRLEERGLIELPPGSGSRVPGRPVRAFSGLPVPVDLIPIAGLELRGADLGSSTLCVRTIREDERLGWRIHMQRYHPLGDRPLVGEHLRYAAFLDDELVALLGWASAAFRAPLREAYVGWDDATKRRRLHLVANNVRFLILPWVRVPHLASKILAANLRRLAADWNETWNHPVYLAETFVDTTRYRGTCYRAANWVHLGQTAGRSKRGNEYLHGGTKKDLFVYPLRRDATQRLREPEGHSAPSRRPST